MTLVNAVMGGVKFGSSDRLRSMYMMCPDREGRDSGEWGGQESEVSQEGFPTKNWGKKPSPRELPSSLKRDVP